MGVTRSDVVHIAKLAKLKIGEEELKRYTEELNQILDYMDKLNELDTSDVEPLAYPVESSNILREDKIIPSVSAEEALKNAPDKTDRHFKVPKVINTDK